MNMVTLKFYFIFCTLPIIESNAQSNFLIDFFVYKNVSYVVGFGCYNIQEKLILTKRFSKLGLRILLPYRNSISQIYKLIYSKYWKVGVFIDIKCLDEHTLQSLSACCDWQVYGEMHSWLILDYKKFSKYVAQLNDTSFGMSTDFVVAVPKNQGYELFDAYNPWKEGGAKINITRLVVWTQNFSFDMSLIQSKFIRRSNLHRITLKASFFKSSYKPKNVSLEEYLQDYSTLSQDAYSKFGYIMLLHLSEMYNFTLQFGEVGTWLADDLLGPMSRALVQNEIQFTGSAVVITYERIRLTKFVYPAWPFRTCFIFRNPQTNVIKIGEVLNPFSYSTWNAMLIALIIIFVVLAFSFAQESCDNSANRWSNSFLTTISSMCQMGTDLYVERISTRIIFFHLMMFSFLSYNHYNAAIISARLNEPILKINDSLNELGKLQLKMASEPMMYFDLIFNIVPPWDRKVFFEDRWLKIPESERFMYPEKGIPTVKKGGFAYHTHPDVSYPIIDKTFTSREICELMEVNPLVPAFAGLCVSYNSTFFELAKIGLSRMTEVGIRYRQLNRWTAKKPQCFGNELSVSSTDIYEFAPHLILLVIGMVMAGIILMLEIIFSERSSHKERYEDMYYTCESSFSVIYSFLLTVCKAKKSKIFES